MKTKQVRNVDRLYQYFVALKNLEVKCNFYCSVNNNKSEGDKASCSQVTLIRSFFFYVLVLKMMIYVISFIGTPVLEKIVEKKYVGIAKSAVIQSALLQFYHFDNFGYLNLASDGYSNSLPAFTALYPAWPMLLRIFGCGKYDGIYESGLYWSPFVSALISMGFWAIGLLLLFRWAARTMSLRMAWSIVLANILLPSSMTFWIGFSESLFFLLFVCFLVFGDSARPWLAWIAAFFLSLTRPVGIMILIIPVVSVLINSRRNIAIGSVFGFLSGWVVYFGIMWYTMDNPLAGWIAQKYHTNQPSLLYILEVQKFFHSFVIVKSFHDPVGSFLDRFVFALVCICLLRLWFIRPSWCLTAFSMLLIPAMTNQFLSFSRFTIVVIPLLVPFGLFILNLNKSWLICLILLSLGAQYYLIYSYFCGNWAT